MLKKIIWFLVLINPIVVDGKEVSLSKPLLFTDPPLKRGELQAVVATKGSLQLQNNCLYFISDHGKNKSLAILPSGSQIKKNEKKEYIVFLKLRNGKDIYTPLRQTFLFGVSPRGNIGKSSKYANCLKGTNEIIHIYGH